MAESTSLTNEETVDGAGVAPSAEPLASTGRIAGKDRYGTSVSISQWTFKEAGDADRVYLARSDVFADALAAGVLTDGPILLVSADCVAPRAVVSTEIERLDPTTVVALGGDSAVCEATLQAAANGRPTDRLSGPNRAATAAAIALYRFGSDGAPAVYIARGNDSPDAVAGGSLTDGPILLISSDGQHVPDVTRAAVEAIDPDTVFALGGAVAVSSDILNRAANGRHVERLAGSDRYATSVKIAQRSFPDPDRVYIARGDGGGLADAVVSGVLTDGPVLLVNGPCDSVPNSVKTYLANEKPDAVVAIGGQGAVCSDLLRQAADAATPPPPGPDCDVVKCVALTFDDGPSAYTSNLVDILDDLDVPATFFIVGQAASARPNTVKRSFDHGYQIENHTWNHPEMNYLSRADQLWQYNSTKNFLTNLGITPTDMLRPPYGAYNANTRTLGVPLILWSIDTRDWENRNTAQIRANVRNNIHPGAIVLQHDTIPQTVDAVPGIVADLRARGYHFVTVEDLVPWAGPGDLVYSRGNVVDASVEAEPQVVDGADFLAPADALELPPLD